MSAPVAAGRLAERIEERERVLGAFLGTEGECLAQACHELARAFSRGGTLIVCGAGPAATDAAHVAVEFMHPVIVGKRALPALATPSDPTGASTLMGLGRPGDIALAICHGAGDPRAAAFLEEGRRRGLLTIAFTGAGGGLAADYAFRVPSDELDVVQEAQETAYHVLWELVHVFFEQPGLLDDACITCGDVAVEARVVSVRDSIATIEREGTREDVAVELVDEVREGDLLLCHAGVALDRLERGEGAPSSGETTDFLYPFLGNDRPDLDAVLADVRASTQRKGADTIELRRGIDTPAIRRCAELLRDRLESGGRLIAFGNGGSSTDAQDVAADALVRGWPAVALNNDVATVTAVGNDVGFDNVFSRQLISLGRAGDIALGISTSGSSANVIAGLEEAHRRLMTCIAIAGYDGGRMAGLDWLDGLFVARSDYIPRLQEAHATIYHLLLEAIGDAP